MNSSNIDDKVVWYILSVDSRNEKKVSAYLTEKGIQTYLPLKVERRKWSDRIKKIETPLFPGYLFVRISYYKERNSSLSHPASRYFLKDPATGNPGVFPDKQMEDLKHMVNEGQDLVVEISRQFPVGATIRILSGPFKGIIAEVENPENPERIFLKIPLFQQMCSLPFDSTDLEILN